MSIRRLFFDLWKSRGRNVRRKLLRDTLISFSVVFAIVASMGIWQYRELRNNLLEESTNHALNEAIEKYEQLITNQQQVFDFLNQVIQDSALSTGSVEYILNSAIETNKSIHTLMVGCSDSTFVYAVGEEGIPTTGRFERGAQHENLLSYMGSQDSGWSSPYFSEISGIPVIGQRSSNRSVFNRSISIELSLIDMYRFLNQITVSKNSEVMLYRPLEKTIFHPAFSVTNSSEQIDDQVFQPYQLSGSKSLIAAFDKMRDLKSPVSFPLVFEMDGQIHWMRARKIESRRDELFVGVIVPESDFIGVLKREFGLFVLFLVSAFLLAAFLLFIVISKYGNQIKDLPQIHVDRKRAESDLHNLIEKGESKHLEFKSTIRFHLKAQRNDKVIEMAWLKGIAGFLNTEGGIMLLGVADDGSIHGLEQDNFDNEDKCRLHIKNLISTHLGVESLSYLSIHFATLESKQIVLLETEHASMPFYIKSNNEDNFYIRTGPASTKLSVSETVDYVKNHF